MKDHVVIVTGSTSGIGEAVAQRLLQGGARVLVTGKDEAQGREAMARLRSHVQAGAGDLYFASGDLAKPDDIDRIVATAVERWGRIDHLVNNAAMMTFKRVGGLALADWNAVIAVNLTAPLLFVRACLPHLRRGSSVVNVSSVHAVETEPGVVPYATSKGGLEAMTRALAVELREQGVRVNAVRLGAIDTPMLWNNPNVKSGEEAFDCSQVGSPGDAADAVLFLLGPHSSFATGSVLNLDGGRLAAL